jgi:hypothetical protein
MGERRLSDEINVTPVAMLTGKAEVTILLTP